MYFTISDTLPVRASISNFVGFCVCDGGHTSELDYVATLYRQRPLSYSPDYPVLKRRKRQFILTSSEEGGDIKAVTSVVTLGTSYQISLILLDPELGDIGWMAIPSYWDALAVFMRGLGFTTVSFVLHEGNITGDQLTTMLEGATELQVVSSDLAVATGSSNIVSTF